MRKLLSALTLTLLLTVNTLADAVDTAAAAEPQSDDLATVLVILIVAIAIPNLIKSRPA